MKFRYVLFDIDDTVLDFRAAEKHALKKTHEQFSLSCSDADCDLYHKINSDLWKEFEKGLISTSDIFVKRFEKYFSARELKFDAKEFRAQYEKNLALQGDVPDDGVEETLAFANDVARVFAVTNGLAKSQKSRLQISGLDKYFEKIYVSETIGYRKPDRKFFEYIERDNIGFRPCDALVVGDSLTADIPAANYGYHTALVDRDGKNTDAFPCVPEYIVTDFRQIKNILGE